MPYGDLTKQERALWDEYQTLRQLTDWVGFDATMAAAKEAARKWLVERRKEIWRLAQPKPRGDGKGWKVAKRKARFEFLKDENLNNGAPKHEVRLPCPGTATAAEKVYIEAREGYLAFASQTDEQKTRKLDNLNWLVNRRKQMYRLMKEDPSNNESTDRQRRYDALCIATHHGKAYENWDKTHNKWGVPVKGHVDEGTREWCVKHARSFIGVVEKPANSNKGTPHPSDWQKRVIGADGYAWCACFTTCMAWDAGVEGSATAGVWNNIEMAKRGHGMYRGFTTDPAKATIADHVAIGCSSCHIELVAKKPSSSGCDTVGGNTAPRPGSGSEYNGGCVADRRRNKGEIVGYLLVRFND